MRIAGFLVKKTAALRLFYFSTFSVDKYGDYFWLNSAGPKKTSATKNWSKNRQFYFSRLFKDLMQVCILLQRNVN